VINANIDNLNNMPVNAIRLKAQGITGAYYYSNNIPLRQFFLLLIIVVIMFVYIMK